MSDVIDPPGDKPVPAVTSHVRRGVAAIVVAVVLVGAGVGSAVALSGDAGGSSTPASAVNTLLAAAQNSDLLGLLNAIAPGERVAVEPGLVTFIHQLQRLDVLSPSANPSKVTGLSLRFNGIETSTQYLDSNVAAVTITHGTMTSSADLSKLPFGSFVTGLTGSLAGKASSKTASAATGRSAIVAVDDGGKWYVSLGYTIAVDALRSAGRSDAIPAPVLAVVPHGATSAQGAVDAFFDSIGTLNLSDMISDLAPGEVAALDSYAPRFLAQANAALAHERSSVSVKFTGLVTSTQSLGAMTLVKVNRVAVSVTSRGTTITVNGRCVTEESQGHSKTTCNTAKQAQGLINLLPVNVKSLLTQLGRSHPDEGIATVEENGKWFISPTATMLQGVNAFVSILQPADLSVISSYARDPAAAKKAFANFERAVASELPHQEVA